MNSAFESARPGWLLDELGSAGRENLDPLHVARYDLIEDAGASDEVVLLRELGMDSESVVVEIGTGTGQFTVAAAPHCKTVIAVDVSPPMLAALAAKLQDTNLDNVQVARAGFLTYQHHGPEADFIYSRYALHHIPDFWKGVAFARAFAALRPGGVMRVWDVVYHFDPSEAEARLEAWCASGGPSGADTWSREDYEEHVRDEHSTYTWVLEAMATRAGFVIEHAAYSDDGIFAQYILRRPDRRAGYAQERGVGPGRER
jgi:SAM-dependent methyltransferase